MKSFILPTKHGSSYAIPLAQELPAPYNQYFKLKIERNNPWATFSSVFFLLLAEPFSSSSVP